MLEFKVVAGSCFVDEFPQDPNANPSATSKSHHLEATYHGRTFRFSFGLDLYMVESWGRGIGGVCSPMRAYTSRAMPATSNVSKDKVGATVIAVIALTGTGMLDSRCLF